MLEETHREIMATMKELHNSANELNLIINKTKRLIYVLTVISLLMWTLGLVLVAYLTSEMASHMHFVPLTASRVDDNRS